MAIRLNIPFIDRLTGADDEHRRRRAQAFAGGDEGLDELKMADAQNEMSKWRASGRAGQPPYPQFLTEEDRRVMQKAIDFLDTTQKLRDNPILGRSTFSSILSPKRPSQMFRSMGLGSGKPFTPPPGVDASIGPTPPSDLTSGNIRKGGSASKPSPGGFNNSVLSGRKQRRTILG